jgi:dTDP-4-dehydrorhamnose reductase
MYLIIGANGYLGSYVIKNILEKTEDDIIATARDIATCEQNNRITWVKCEVTDKEDVDNLSELTAKNTEVKVVYLAAYHKPDMVQKNPKIAWNINITALSNMINQLVNIKCLFYASTDSVYGSSVNRYHFKEEDCLKPENIYGRQKQTAEAVVTGYGYNVVRYPFLIGTSLLKKKRHFYDEIVAQIKAGKSFDMFEDSYRSSLDFNTAAGLLIELMETYEEEYPQILNISGDEDLSKYDVGIRVAEKENCATALIHPIRMNEKTGIFTAPRATSTLMDNSRVKRLLGLSEIKLQL